MYVLLPPFNKIEQTEVDQVAPFLFLKQILEGAKGCNSCTTDPEQRTHLLRRLLIALSRNTQAVPRSFLINGIEVQDRDAVGGGGFADIFRAIYKDQPVALKRLRTFMNQPVTASEENVSDIRPRFCAGDE